MTNPNEHRRSIRVVVTNLVDVQCLGATLPLHLLNVSVGGFSVSSSTAVQVGVILSFRFSMSSGDWSAVLKGQSAYSRLHRPSSAEGPRYVSGFMFVEPESPPVQQRILELMDRATADVTFS